MTTTIRVVNSGFEAMGEVRQLHGTGVSHDDIYVLAHDEDRTNRVADMTNVKKVGFDEEGMFDSLANLVRSRGEELRAKMRSIGCPENEIDQLERQLDQGKILIVATGNRLH